MTIHIHMQPDESIGQALARAALIAQPKDCPHEVIMIPPGVHIVGSNLKQTRIIDRRTTGIPFLNNARQP